jgi:hypothetical protein
MLARLAAAILIAATGYLSLVGPIAANPIYPTGSRVGIEPPPGMTLTPNTPQFRDPAHSATVVVLDLPFIAYGDVERSLFAPPNDPNITVLGREPFFFKYGSGILAQIRL